MKRISIKLDVDDVLMPYMTILSEEAAKHGVYKKYEEFKSWDFIECNKSERLILRQIINSGVVMEHQKPFPGAVNFIHYLQAMGHDVHISTSVEDDLADFRRKQIHLFFPTIPDDHIHITHRKEDLVCDIHVDDCAKYIQASHDTYPVLWRRPWNESVTNYLTVDNYQSVLRIVDCVANGKTPADIVCLVGPSASGKTTITTALEETGLFKAIISSTSRNPRPDDGPDAYYFVSREQFEADVAANKLIEHIEYNGNYYGLSKMAVEKATANNMIAVTPIEINGMRAVQRAFGQRVATMYIDRDTEAIIAAINARNVPEGDKRKRLESLPIEMQNISKTDYIIENKSNVSDAAEQIINVLGFKTASVNAA